MAYTGQQQFLLRAAQQYSELGYKVALCKGKEIIGNYQPDEVVAAWFGNVAKIPSKNNPTDFDGISVIPDGIVCVDIDVPDFGVIWEPLPPTFKERTPRGWHLFYKVSDLTRDRAVPKIKWREHVDLLAIRGKSTPPVKKVSAYGKKNGAPPWGGHVLISPTSGYQRIWPDDAPATNKLTDAPQWLVDALEKP